MIELRGRLEPLAVDGEGIRESVRREMGSEGVRQSEDGGDLCPVGARPENPERDVGVGAGDGLDRLIERDRAEEELELLDVAREPLGGGRVATEELPGHLIGAWGAPQAEVDPSRVER